MSRKFLPAMFAVAVMFTACKNSDDTTPTKVYALGQQNLPGDGVLIVKLWNDGVATDLPHGTTIHYATSVFASGKDVYLSGYEIGSGAKILAKLWNK